MRRRMWMTGGLALFAATATAESTVSTEFGPRRFEAQRATSAIQIDGVLDEAAWADALVFDLPYEWQPGDRIPPPVRTEFLLTYDDTHLYAAWRCFDPDPGRIRANLMDRNAIATLVQDDHVVLMIDPFNDERRAFQFRVNPLGVQADAIFSENEGIEDFSYDMIWDSAGEIGAEGYVVEVAIPFHQLRFPRTTGPQTWGFDVQRSYPRSVRHRIASWPRDRNRRCILCQVDKVTGFEELESGRNLELTPTVTGLRADVRTDFPNGPLEKQDETADLGLSVRWGVTSDLTLNAAIQPDFSQVEADVAELNVNRRFALFFPEKRPFFLEGIDMFATPIEAVFTRTVVDPDWGVKISGKQNGNALGAFATRDTQNSFLIPSNEQSIPVTLDREEVDAAVLRYRRDLGAGSTIGALYAGREGNHYGNHVYGGDLFWRLNAADTIRVQALQARSRYPQAIVEGFDQPQGTFDDVALFADHQHQSRDWFWSLRYEDRGRDFRADSGFLPRVDLREGEARLNRTWWSDGESWYDRVVLGGRLRRTEDQSGDLTDERLIAFGNVTGPWQSVGELVLVRAKERFGDTLHEELDQVELYLEAQPSGVARFTLFAAGGEGIDFANNRPADFIEIAPTAELKLGRHVNAQLRHSRQRFDVEGGRLFTADLSQLRLVYNLNVRTFARAIVQYLDLDRDPALYLDPVDRSTEQLFLQLLLSYKLNPQTVVFLGYSDTSLGIDPVDQLRIDRTRVDRTFFLKIGYAFLF